MNCKRAAVLLTALLVVPMLGSAQSDRAVIHFADLNGAILDWRPEGDRALLIEAGNRQWYRAELFAPCVSLRFSQTIAFVTDPLGDIDQFSSILVDGERCWFKSFERTSAPGLEKDAAEVEMPQSR